jgi:hypothetical protein
MLKANDSLQVLELTRILYSFFFFFLKIKDNNANTIDITKLGDALKYNRL